MVPLKVKCPDNAWPPSFSGYVALAVLGAAHKPNSTLWLTFAMQKGKVAEVHGCLVEGDEMPDAVKAMEPSIITRAAKKVWESIVKDKAAFYGAVESAEVHISGDFRTFGRYTPSLIRLTEGTDLWVNLDRVVAEVVKMSRR